MKKSEYESAHNIAKKYLKLICALKTNNRIKQSTLMILIIGLGFVGSRLVSSLNLDECCIFDKNQSPFFQDITTIGNILDKKTLNKSLQNIETVVLLAAEHRDDVSPTLSLL